MRSQQMPHAKTKLEKKCRALTWSQYSRARTSTLSGMFVTVQLRLSIAESARQPKRLKTLVRCQVGCTNKGGAGDSQSATYERSGRKESVT